MNSVSRHSPANTYCVLSYCMEGSAEKALGTVVWQYFFWKGHMRTTSVSYLQNFRFLCGYLLIFLWTILSQRQRNIYLYPLFSSNYFFFFFIRTPRKQSSSCPFFSGQAVLRPWWNMSLVALVSSSICLRRLASSPSCSQVSACHKWLPVSLLGSLSPPVFPPFLQIQAFGE